MTGLAVALGLALLTFGLLWRLGLHGIPALLAAAVIAAGSAGYAWQGRPDLAAAPRAAGQRPPPLPLAGARTRLMGEFPNGGQWLVMADALEAQGETEQAVRLLQRAVQLHPDAYALWVGLGNALADHGQRMTPAATYAYDHAQALAPLRPAPRFFHGLALARSGDRDGALAQWQRLLNDTPSSAGWRPLVTAAIAAFAPPPAAPPGPVPVPAPEAG